MNVENKGGLVVVSGSCLCMGLNDWENGRNENRTAEI